MASLFGRGFNPLHLHLIEFKAAGFSAAFLCYVNKMLLCLRLLMFVCEICSVVKMGLI